MLAPRHYTPHPRFPDLICTLQRVVDEVSLLMWMPGQCWGTTTILLRGPSGPRAGARAAPAESAASPRMHCLATPGCIASWWPFRCASAGECASTHSAVGRPLACAPRPSPGHGGAGAHHRLVIRAAGDGLMAMGANVAHPLGHGIYSGAAAAVDCHRSGRGGPIQILRGVRGTQVPRATVQWAPVLLPPHGGLVAGRAPPGAEHAPP